MTPPADLKQATDFTLYQSPPPVNHPHFAPQSLFQSPAPPPASIVRDYKISLELQTIELVPTKAPYSDLVLSYRYTALHPRMISTAPGFPAAPTRPTPLPSRGYCEFSFAMQEAKMKDTFGKHLVKVLMKEAGVG